MGFDARIALSLKSFLNYGGSGKSGGLTPDKRRAGCDRAPTHAFANLCQTKLSM